MNFHLRSKFIIKKGLLQRLLEAVFLPIIFIAICLIVNPKDPFFLRGTFPWVWVAPLLIAIRYGVLCGILSSGIVIVGMLMFEPSAIMDAVNYRYFILGGILVTYICGEFNERFYSRVIRSEQFNSYARERISSISNAYYIIKTSHDRLQDTIIGKQTSLRNTFKEFKKLVVEYSGKFSEEIAERFLYLLADYCAIENANLYLIKNNSPQTKSFAHIGTEEKLIADDILVEKTLTNDQVNYFAVNHIDKMIKSNYLVIVPIKTCCKKLIAIIAIKKMTFWAMKKETMQKLAALSQYFADSIWNAKIAASLIQKRPDCPNDFAAELFRLSKLKNDVKTNSMLVAFKISTDIAQHEAIVNSIIKKQRAFDSSWIIKNDKITRVLIIMPFFPNDIIQTYTDRVSSFISKEFDFRITKNNFSVVYEAVPETEPDVFMLHFLDKIDVS